MLPDNNMPIQMFPVVDTTGDSRPLRFRFEDKDHAIRTVDNIKTIQTQECNYVGQRCIKCICTAPITEEGREAMFEIRFLIESHKWIFYKMLS